jgi:hypothetical protein
VGDGRIQPRHEENQDSDGMANEGDRRKAGVRAGRAKGWDGHHAGTAGGGWALASVAYGVAGKWDPMTCRVALEDWVPLSFSSPV